MVLLCVSSVLFIYCVCHVLASVHCCLVETWRERVFTYWLLFVMLIVILLLSHSVSLDRCGTWLYRFLILAVFLNLRVPALKNIGGLLMYLFKRRLKDGTGEVCFVSFGKLFHARIVERKNELNYRCVGYPLHTRPRSYYVLKNWMDVVRTCST